MNNAELLKSGRADEVWLSMGKNEMKLLLRQEQNGICPSCQLELPEEPKLFDLTRVDGHPYSKRDYRDKSICSVKHPSPCHQGVDHGNIPWFSELRRVAQDREDYQRMRIRMENRNGASERGMDDDVPEALKINLGRLRDMEQEANQVIKNMAKDAPEIWQQALEVKGVGEITLTRIMAEIDINRAEYPSSLHKFAGFAPGYDRMEKGEKENGRRKRGAKRPYNARLRVSCRVLGDSFLKASSPYRADYDFYRTRDEVQNPGLTKAHYHNRAMRYMMKMFLSHLWLRWRTLEGLTTARPYANDHLGHSGYIDPTERGWPAINGE